jgi:hypothetical protein
MDYFQLTEEARVLWKRIIQTAHMETAAGDYLTARRYHAAARQAWQRYLRRIALRGREGAGDYHDEFTPRRRTYSSSRPPRRAGSRADTPSRKDGMR